MGLIIGDNYRFEIDWLMGEVPGGIIVPSKHEVWAESTLKNVQGDINNSILEVIILNLMSIVEIGILHLWGLHSL